MGESSTETLQNLIEGPVREQNLTALRQSLIEGGDQELAGGGAGLLEQYALMLEVSQTLAGDLSLNVLLPSIVDILTRALKAERGTLFLYDRESGELFSRVTNGSVAEIRIPSSSGIAGAVFTEQESLNIPDAYADPRFNQAVDQETGFRTRNILCAPLRNRTGGVIGVTQVMNKHEGVFSLVDSALMESLMAHAASALEHAQLFEQLEKTRREETRFQALMNAVSSELNLERLIETIIVGAAELIEAERGTFFLYDGNSDELWSIVAEGVAVKELRIPSDAGIAGWTFTRGKVVNIPDVYADKRFNPAVDRRTGFRTRNILCMPVRNKLGKVLGVTQLLNKREGSFTEADERRLQAFCSQVVAGVENAQLFDEVLQLKNFNEGILTSLTNGVITLGVDNKVTKVNEAGCRILGVVEEELVGRNAASYFGNYNPWVVKSLDDVAKSGKPDFHLDTDLYRDSEEIVSVNMNVTPLCSIQGEWIGSLLVLEDITREKRVRGTMARYMAKEVVDKLLESGEDVLAGTLQEVTILFSDIRRFTTLSEKLGTQKTVALLNEYFTEMVEIVFRHGGTLDKYIGDSIMALFGAPISNPHDADSAHIVAKEMMLRLQQFNAARIKAGDDPIRIGIGLATGQVVAGSIGSTKRMEYTVVGDKVNLAARLESANKYYGTEVLMCADTVAQQSCREFLREIDTLRARGFSKSMPIYESFAHFPEEIRDKLAEQLPRFHQGLTAYRGRRWSEAVDCFAGALARHSADRPSQIWLNRCLHFRDNPPPDEWDGVWTQQAA